MWEALLPNIVAQMLGMVGDNEHLYLYILFGPIYQYSPHSTYNVNWSPHPCPSTQKTSIRESERQFKCHHLMSQALMMHEWE
jgi:hypothetical protein